MRVIYGVGIKSVIVESDDSIDIIASQIHMTADELRDIVQTIVDEDAQNTIESSKSD